jgi:hypothetical protein
MQLTLSFCVALTIISINLEFHLHHKVCSFCCILQLKAEKVLLCPFIPHILYLQLMVPVATERLITSHQTPSGELMDEELEEDEVAGAWAADVLQFPSSLELDIRVHKGAESLGKN